MRHKLALSNTLNNRQNGYEARIFVQELITKRKFLAR